MSCLIHNHNGCKSMPFHITNSLVLSAEATAGGPYLIAMQIIAVPVRKPLQRKKTRQKKSGSCKPSVPAVGCKPAHSKVAALSIRSYPHSSLRRGRVQMSTPVILHQEVNSRTVRPFSPNFQPTDPISRFSTCRKHGMYPNSCWLLAASHRGES